MKIKLKRLKKNVQHNKRFRINYQIFFMFLAIYSFATSLLDLHGDISISKNPILEFIDFSIYLIFAIDYIVRFIFAKYKANFIENNIPDLISIIPYYSIFRLFRIFKIRKFAKLFRYLKLSKLYLFVKKTYKKIKKFLKLNGLIYLLMMAALGIVAIFLMLIGVGTFGMITGTVTTYFLNKQNEFVPDDDLEKFILKSENYSDSEKKEIITFIDFLKSKREK